MADSADFIQRKLANDVKDYITDAITEVRESTLPYKQVILVVLEDIFQTIARSNRVYRPFRFSIAHGAFIVMVWSVETSDWEIYMIFQPSSERMDIAPSIETSIPALMKSLPVAVKADFRFTIVADSYHKLMEFGYRLVAKPKTIDNDHLTIWHSPRDTVVVSVSQVVLEELNSDPACLEMDKLFADALLEED